MSELPDAGHPIRRGIRTMALVDAMLRIRNQRAPQHSAAANIAVSGRQRGGSSRPVGNRP